jgi:hypothetical protein
MAVGVMAARPVGQGGDRMSKVRSVKRQIDAKRQEKAKAKRDRRQGVGQPGEDLAPEETLPPLTETEFLAAVQEATAQFEAGTLDFEEFEDTKNELFGRLQS